ncbi:hypothetical protein [uncultured Shewanella sp.]|uniref:hypothetical protein n=1 Tax=uncultured Shewanella sp. TaxID=173975 RepID=UPI00261ABF51|nr:hypothetical protein [uncultured Shewanella sp.]
MKLITYTAIFLLAVLFCMSESGQIFMTWIEPYASWHKLSKTLEVLLGRLDYFLAAM